MINISECCFSAGKKNILYKTIWILTKECHWRCSYCGVNRRQRKSYQRLSLQDNMSILHKLKELGINNLVLTGGEPLLLKNDLITLLDLSLKLGMSFSLSTTGEPKEILLDVLDRKPRKISFSLDASDPKIHDKIRGPGSYQYALEIFELLKERNIPTHICSVLTRYNYRNVKSLLKFIKENTDNITGLSVQNQYPVGSGETDFPLIYDELVQVLQDIEKYPIEKVPIGLVNTPDIHYPLEECPAGQRLFSIFPDGTYTSCPFLLDISDDFALGNILSDSLELVCKRLKDCANSINSELKKMSASTEACSECQKRNICGLGCYVLKVAHKLTYKMPTLRCEKIVESQRRRQKELSFEEESQIRKFVKAELERSDIAHKFDHIENVVALAKMIGREEGANLRIIVPAAYFHDIVPRENLDSMREHVKESNKKAQEYLKKNLNFTSGEVDNVTHAIISSAWESYLEGCNPETLEAKVVRDADWMDAIGARGIARVFGFAGSRGLEMGDIEHDPETPAMLPCNPNKIDPTPLYHFFSKLLWLKDNMQTNRGKAEAETRHNFMVNFLKAYKSETQYIVKEEKVL